MKYIILEQNMGNGHIRRVPIIFPNFLTHAIVAETLSLSKELTDISAVSAVSAGTVQSDHVLTDGATLFGGSSSLNVDSHPDDFELIRTVDATRGIIK